jgi:DtxR family Mn-dependent transcriptional regulator
MNTISEENYIKAIYKLSNESKTDVSTSIIADYLTTKASSVTDMVQKLADKSLINYKKYQGVSLTPEGEKAAVKIIRKHRLWEHFLFHVLGFKWNEIHDIAEELEHIKSDILIERLDKFLNYPRNDPHGDPIPDKNGILPENKSVQLSLLPVRTSGVVVGVNDNSSSFLTYLDKVGIKLGTQIEIMEINEFDQSFDVKLNNTETTHLSHLAAQSILMKEL